MSANGEDSLWRSGPVFDLLSNPSDVHVNGALIDVVFASSDPIEDIVSGKCLAGISGEQRWKVEFLRLHRNGNAVEEHLPAVHVDPQAPARNHPRKEESVHERMPMFGPPQHRLDPGDEFPHAEWLGHVVVGAHFETHHLVYFFPLGREHQDGNTAFGSEDAAYLNSVHRGQHDVEDDHAWWPGARRLQRFTSVGGRLDEVALPLQVMPQRSDQVLFILHDEDGAWFLAWRGIPCSCSKPFPIVYNRFDGLPIVWSCFGLLLAPRKQREDRSMHEVALLSRLRATCANADGVEWDWKDSTVELARKLIDKDKDSWEMFSSKYDMFFNYEAGLFSDIKEMAYVLVEGRRSKDPKILRQVAELEELLGLEP